MAIDPGAAEMMRDDLSALDGISEKKMFGGLGFMRGGHMLTGVMSTGALLYRVGKTHEAAALALPGVAVMAMADRVMGGFVMLTGEAQADEESRARLLALALENASELPPKE
ncbi:TfoX/Sxy family protein [uncultured Paracoccus sp.]|uniref:TfoX/Sxy family protein n=1 Tax=uncultured Paracoccus sp. TaxID=189685 RepID=UPI0026296025|nr:TfoX/Sxy family protein [uncultured Paracoccus sp.]